MTPTPLLDDYLLTLAGKAPGTLDGYRRALYAFTIWLVQLLGFDQASINSMFKSPICLARD